jgi:hypothetical protein
MLEIVSERGFNPRRERDTCRRIDSGGGLAYADLDACENMRAPSGPFRQMGRLCPDRTVRR